MKMKVPKWWWNLFNHIRPTQKVDYFKFMFTFQPHIQFTHSLIYRYSACCRLYLLRLVFVYPNDNIGLSPVITYDPLACLSIEPIIELLYTVYNLFKMTNRQEQNSGLIELAGQLLKSDTIQIFELSNIYLDLKF